MYLEIQIYIFKLKLTSNFGTKTKNEKPRIVTYQNPGERQCVLPSSKLKEKKKKHYLNALTKFLFSFNQGFGYHCTKKDECYMRD